MTRGSANGMGQPWVGGAKFDARGGLSAGNAWTGERARPVASIIRLSVTTSCTARLTALSPLPAV
jgi:hypothetical protein